LPLHNLTLTHLRHTIVEIIPHTTSHTPHAPEPQPVLQSDTGVRYSFQTLLAQIIYQLCRSFVCLIEFMTPFAQSIEQIASNLSTTVANQFFVCLFKLTFFKPTEKHFHICHLPSEVDQKFLCVDLLVLVLAQLRFCS
jgi:hypothetical protein